MFTHSLRTRSNQFCTLAVTLIVLGLAAPVVADELVPYGSAPPLGDPGHPGYRYKIVEHGATDPAFPDCSGVLDDSWQHGASPWFGQPEDCGTIENPNCDPNLCALLGAAAAETAWGPPTVTDILVCYTLELCGELDTIDDVSLRVDNDSMVFVDGVQGTVTGGIGELGDGNAPFCWSDSTADPNNDGLTDDGLCMTEGCPDSGILVPGGGAGFDKVIHTGFGASGPGPHFIAVRARNRAQQSFLDIEVNGTGTVGPCLEVCEPTGDDDDDDDDDDDETQEFKDE